MKLPSPDDHANADGLSEALTDMLRLAPLTGPKKSITKEVRDWAREQGLSPETAGLLDRYNEVARELPDKLRKQLQALAETDRGRPAVLALLGQTGTSDPVRLLVLEALHGRLEPRDATELARLNVKQRPHVVGSAIRALAEIRSGMALFALAKVFALRDDEAAEIARRLASRLWAELPEAVVAREASAGESLSFALNELEPVELLGTTMALSSRAQAQLPSVDHGRELLARIEPAAFELDRGLREEAQSSSGLNPFEMRVRDELLELVLLTGTHGEDAQKRAAENLFRREELSEVEELAPHLPGPVLESYAQRSLTKENRRRARPERAAFALGLVRVREQSVREALRSLAIECLDEGDQELKYEAARVLAVDEADLAPGVRARLSAAYDELPPRLQSRLARELRGVSDAPTQLSSFLRWVDAARGDDVKRRLSELLARWAGETDLGVEEVSRVMEVFAGGFAQLSEAHRRAITPDLVDVSSAWLHAQGGRVVGPVEALLAWQGFRGVIVDNVARFAQRLRAEQARALLAEAIGVRAGALNAELLATASQQDVGEQDERRLLQPVLVEGAKVDPGETGSAISLAATHGKRRVLAAGIVADVEVKAEIARLERALERGTTPGLVAKQEVLLEALREAEEAAAGNERLAELLGEIGKAVTGEASADPHQEGDRSAQSAESVASDENRPPEGVSKWRVAAQERFAGAVRAPAAGQQPLELEDDFMGHADELVALLTELDRRAHSKRVAPLAERDHYRRDLISLIESSVRAGIVAPSAGGDQSIEPSDQLGAAGLALVELFDRGRPELRRLFWDTAASSTGGRGDAELGLRDAIATAAQGPADRGKLSMLEAALARANPESAWAAAAGLEEHAIQQGWRALATLLDLDLRKARELRDRERGKDQAIGMEIGAELDLPFRVIEHLLFSYFRLREQVGEVGWKPIEERLGRVRRRAQLDPEMHEVRGDRRADRFVVHSLGIKYNGVPVSRAVLEPLVEGEELLEEAVPEADGPENEEMQ